MHAHVATLRSFNRSFTQRIGVLEDSFLGSGRALGPARLLYEIGPRGAGVLDLRARLGLDSGYVSRLLRQLESDDLVVVEADPADGRRRNSRLTERGLAEWRMLDRRSDELAERLVTPLSERRRDELSAALTTAGRLLRAATTIFEIVEPTSDDAVSALTQYFAELDDRFSTGFDPGDTLTADAPSMRMPLGMFVVASSDGEPVACGAVRIIDEHSAEIKRMWVHHEMRGVGLGQRMLTFLEDCVRQLGRRRVLLDTNVTLLEAIAMYERAGYTSIDRYSDNPYASRWFSRQLD
jgi:DNA-binding MarR family transcriptional regulator/N-acetylglutamate synthase-like GNAT family acetyltransferase